MLKKEDYITLFNDALKRNETIILGCNCKVRYSGRAESTLDWGDRVLIIKSDKAILVHQPTGNAPINYMKPDTAHSLKLDNGLLRLDSVHQANKESLKVQIRKIHFYNSHKLEDGQTITITGTEKDMSDMLYKHPEMIEKGFKTAGREEQTKYGFVDVLGVDKNRVLTVIECKRYQADLGAVTQLRRYVEKIMVTKGITKVRGIIAAPKITENAKKMLEDWGFEYKRINPPKYYDEDNKKQTRLDNFEEKD